MIIPRVTGDRGIGKTIPAVRLRVPCSFVPDFTVMLETSVAEDLLNAHKQKIYVEPLENDEGSSKYENNQSNI